jgi:hypothetical protein
MPRERIVELGSGALPILADLLRDESKKHCWLNAASLFGFWADTSYFDTLRVFVWERHRGLVDNETYEAAMAAQGSIAAMAPKSARAYRYLARTKSLDSWRTLPWRVAGMQDDVLHRELASWFERISRGADVRPDGMTTKTETK